MRRRSIAALAALTLSSAAITTELALPSVAENRMRDQLEKFGSVSSVEVSESPAIMLLFGGPESASIRMSDATLDASVMTPEMLGRAGSVDGLDLQIDSLRAGPVDVESVVLHKRGRTLDALATLDTDQVERLVPGARLKVQDGKMLLALPDLPIPLPGPVRLQIDLEDGMVVARPLGAASMLLPAQPLLDQPELSVTRLHSRITNGKVRVSADATLAL